jgi:hypothetical protein
MFRDGVTFETLPNLCKRNSPLEKQVGTRNSLYKVFEVLYKLKVQVLLFGAESFLNKKCG